MAISNIKTGELSTSLKPTWSTGSRSTIRILPIKGEGLYNAYKCKQQFIPFYTFIQTGYCSPFTDAQHGSIPDRDTSVNNIQIDSTTRKILR